MWDLVPRPGIKPGPPAVRVQSVSHWTTRKVLGSRYLQQIFILPTILRCQTYIFIYFSKSRYLLQTPCLPSWRKFIHSHVWGILSPSVVLVKRFQMALGKGWGGVGLCGLKEKSVAFASFHGVNIPTTADF